jgi:hypothetical protein
MKKNVLKAGLFTMILVGMISCVSKEKELADKRINELESFVDSLKMVTAEDRQANWDQIVADYDAKHASVNEALLELEETDKMTSQEKVNVSNAKYDELKVTVISKNETEPAFEKNTKTKKNSASQVLRDKIFGSGRIGSDLNFAWVNKTNILSVYDTFFNSYKKNKDSFSREDYDEIKLMFEALDSRKNTVEKEGLSTEDNMKISSIKMKFSPMYKLNRAGAKSIENKESKE